jgi:UDP-glucose 4-epimerase
MRILITGGFGYLGSRLGQFFDKKGCKVVLGTRKNQGPPLWLPNAEIAIMNWNDFEQLKKKCAGVNVVLHCAGVNSKDSQEDPRAAFAFNEAATEGIVKAAATSRVKSFIYFSTSHVYSKSCVGEFGEETNPENEHPYALSHLLGERHVLCNSIIGSMKTTVLRISNVVGFPGNPQANCWTLIANDLCKQAINSSSLKLNTNGQQARDFIGISEFAQVLDFLIDRKNVSASEIFNVGGNKSLSIFQFAQLIQERVKHLFGKTLNIEVPGEGSVISAEYFKYSTKTLTKAGYVANDSLITDIDELLQYCKKM